MLAYLIICMKFHFDKRKIYVQHFLKQSTCTIHKICLLAIPFQRHISQTPIQHFLRLSFWTLHKICLLAIHFSKANLPIWMLCKGLTPMKKLSCSSVIVICPFTLTYFHQIKPEFCQTKCDTLYIQCSTINLCQNKNFTEFGNKTSRHYCCSCQLESLNKHFNSPVKFPKAQNLTLHMKYSNFNSYSLKILVSPRQYHSSLGQVLSL